MSLNADADYTGGKETQLKPSVHKLLLIFRPLRKETDGRQPVFFLPGNVSILN